MIRDPKLTFLSSGCFLNALISGQLGPTVQSSFVLPEHELSTPDVEVQCGTARAAPCTEHDLSHDPECAQRESAPVLLPLSNTAALLVYPGDAATAPQISPVTTGEIIPMKKIMPRLSWPKE